jgi:hypothetical protein
VQEEVVVVVEEEEEKEEEEQVEVEVARWSDDECGCGREERDPHCGLILLKAQLITW